MTKYRTVSNGYAKYLQYLYEYKYLFCFTREKWCYVWKPYYNRVYGRSLDICGYNTYVCSYSHDLKEFSNKWPDINKYFEWAEKEQKRLESDVEKFHNEVNNKRGQVDYI